MTDDAERDGPAVRAAERYRGQIYRRFNKDESAAGGVQATRGKPASRKHGWSATMRQGWDASTFFQVWSGSNHVMRSASDFV